ncbi:MAG: GNAT family N-acetyltransferase [Promethearchaeota archaeon]
MTIIICPIKIEDKENVLSIARRIPGNFFDKVFDYWIADPQNLFYGIFINKELVGFGDLFLHASKEAWLQGIRIIPEFQRQGLATKLVDYVETLCANKAIKIIRFNTAPQNENMIRLGIKRGYKKNRDWIVCRASAEEMKHMLDNSTEADRVPFKTLRVNPISLYFSQYHRPFPPTELLFSDFRTYSWQSIQNKTAPTHPTPYLIIAEDEEVGISVQDMDPKLHQTTLLGTTIGFIWGSSTTGEKLLRTFISQKLEEGYKKFRIGLPDNFESIFLNLGFYLQDPDHQILWSVYSKDLNVSYNRKI